MRQRASHELVLLRSNPPRHGRIEHQDEPVAGTNGVERPAARSCRRELAGGWPGQEDSQEELDLAVGNQEVVLVLVDIQEVVLVLVENQEEVQRCTPIVSASPEIGQ